MRNAVEEVIPLLHVTITDKLRRRTRVIAALDTTITTEIASTTMRVKVVTEVVVTPETRKRRAWISQLRRLVSVVRVLLDFTMTEEFVNRTSVMR